MGSGCGSNVDNISMETFKIAKGDNAARKSASRDVNCINTLHKLDLHNSEDNNDENIYTSLTILVDYLGTRYVCQSVIPGILHGEKTHELLCGAVEANSPLKIDKHFHELLQNVIGKYCFIGTRNVPIYPLSSQQQQQKDDNDIKDDDEKKKKEDET